MLKIKTSCEKCNDAMICSFECTFCKNCVENELKNICPNCGGGFEKRPIRPIKLLDKYPPQD